MTLQQMAQLVASKIASLRGERPTDSDFTEATRWVELYKLIHTVDGKYVETVPVWNNLMHLHGLRIEYLYESSVYGSSKLSIGADERGFGPKEG